MRKPVLVLVVSSLFVATPTFAQRSTGSIRGTVRDATQSVLPGATVTVLNEETGLSRTVVTNAAGVYSVPVLPVGLYKVTAELQGFKGGSRTGVILRVADVLGIDFELGAGQISEVVTVEATSTPVKTNGGDVSGVVTGEMVRELPLNGRNFLQLATLMPGVSAPDFLNVKDKGLLGGSDLSVSGSDVTANMWTVDGANNNDVGSNRTILVYPSLDAIEEFKILRNSYGPEFGGAGGAQINIVTRSGGNDFHGSVFYFGRNDALIAKNTLLRPSDPKQLLRRNDYGYTIGGPIKKDKVFFFWSEEWNKEKRARVRSKQIPTLAERGGDYRDMMPNVATGFAGCTNQIPTDPFNGNAPFTFNGKTNVID